MLGIIKENTMFTSIMENLVLIHYLFIFIASMLLSMFLSFYVVITPRLWYLGIPYIVWLYFDWNTPERGGRIWLPLRNLPLWNYFASYFSAKLIKTAELPPDRNYIICSHPHGIVTFGTFISFGTEGTNFSATYPGLELPRLVALSQNFMFPLRREYILMHGFVSSSRRAIGAVIKQSDKGNIAVILPGGSEEALEAHPGLYNVVLANRKGFVKLALKYGADLVPCYQFGEQMIFGQKPNPKGSPLRNFQEKLKNIVGFTLPLFYGRYGYLPFRRPITTVVGAPIKVKQKSKPTEEEVNALHEQYCQALKSLFNEHKLKYDSLATEETELNII